MKICALFINPNVYEDGVSSTFGVQADAYLRDLDDDTYGRQAISCQVNIDIEEPEATYKDALENKLVEMVGDTYQQWGWTIAKEDIRWFP